jgi:hypothetical protein
VKALRAAALLMILTPVHAVGQEASGLPAMAQWQQANTTMVQLVATGFRLVFVTHDESKLKDGESYTSTTYYLQSDSTMAKCQEASIFNAAEMAKSIGAGRDMLGRASVPMTGFWCATLTRPYPLNPAR